MNHLQANSDHNQKSVDPDWFFQRESSPYQPDQIEAGRGSMPTLVRYMPHVIIVWGMGYVLFQAESNLINYVAATLLLLWSGYTLIAIKKKWPPFP